jgi:hypothetical protein
MVIKVNWREVKRIDQRLRRQGWGRNTSLNLHVYFLENHKDKPKKVTARITFENWLSRLYEVEGNKQTISVVITDASSTRVIWETKANSQLKENIPIMGHGHIIRDFSSFDSTQRRAWIKMTEVALLDYTDENYDH